MERISESLVRLNVTRFHYYDQVTHGGTVTLESNTGETVLARLTSSERMNSTAGLAAHLFHMLHMQSSVVKVRDESRSGVSSLWKQPTYYTDDQAEGADMEPNRSTEIEAPPHS
jgi:hypothetical protein